MAVVIFIFIAIYLINHNKGSKHPENDFDAEHSRNRNFFFYEREEELEKFLEAQIFPYLPDEIEVITPDDNDLFFDYPQTVVTTLLHKQIDDDAFPHLIKLREGKQFELSIYDETFECINRGKPVEPLLWKIYEFFEVTGKAV
jgi:hypothetical protein